MFSLHKKSVFELVIQTPDFHHIVNGRIAKDTRGKALLLLVLCKKNVKKSLLTIQTQEKYFLQSINQIVWDGSSKI